MTLSVDAYKTQRFHQLLLKQVLDVKDKSLKPEVLSAITPPYLYNDPILSKYVLASSLAFYTKLEKEGVIQVSETMKGIPEDCIGYCYSDNTLQLIWVSSELLEDPTYFLTVYMHEVGHHVMLNVFNNHALPFYQDDLIAGQAYTSTAIAIIEKMWQSFMGNGSPIDAARYISDHPYMEEMMDQLPRSVCTTKNSQNSPSACLALSMYYALEEELPVLLPELLSNPRIDCAHDSIFLLMQDYYFNYIEPCLDQYIMASLSEIRYPPAFLSGIVELDYTIYI